jgi:hypothetical protein
VVEVERPRPLTDLKKMKDGEAAVASLEGNPGFQYLLAKFKIQRALLERTLRTQPPTDLVAICNLQQGIFWCGWLEDQLTQSKSRLERNSQQTTAEELKLFKEIHSAMTMVGA